MSRRWIIRGFFTAVLLLSLQGWIWTSVRSDIFDYSHFGKGYHGFTCSFARCGVELTVSEGIGGREGWTHWVLLDRSMQLWPWGDGGSVSESLGLGWRAYDFNDGTTIAWSRSILLPFWLIVIMSAGMLWYVWHKTRPTLIAQAFPMEAKPLTTDHRPLASSAQFR